MANREIMNNLDYYKEQELKIEISNIRIEKFITGDSGTIIYCKISNISDEDIHVRIDKAYIINKKNEQRENDSLLSGYSFESGIVLGQTNRIIGHIFYKDTAGAKPLGWKYFISVLDEQHGKRYNVTFSIQNLDKWSITSCDIFKDKNIKSVKSLEKELRAKVEKIDECENETGIALDNISFKIDDKHQQLKVFCECRWQRDKKVKSTAYIKVILYNEDGEIIGINYEIMEIKGTSGFDACDIEFKNLDVDHIGKIKIYPIIQ